MKIILKRIEAFVREDDGPAATEYAVLLALIAAVIIVTVGLFGARVNDLYASVVGAGW